MGAQQAFIDWKVVDEMLESNCSGIEIAGFFGIHFDTFYDRFKQKHNTPITLYAQAKKSRGEARLRLHQFKKALGEAKDGSDSMLSLLGKTRLGQTDKVIVQSSNEATQQWLDNQNGKSKDLVDESTGE